MLAEGRVTVCSCSGRIWMGKHSGTEAKCHVSLQLSGCLAAKSLNMSQAHQHWPGFA